MKNAQISIVALGLFLFSCSAVKDLTKEEQAAYDVINAIGLDLYYKTLSNDLHNNDSDIISEFIYNKQTSPLWNMSSPPYKPVLLTELFSEKELESLKAKARNTKKIKLNRDYILNNIALYKSKDYSTRINFPILSQDGTYAVVYFQNYMEESIKIYKKEEGAWKQYVYASISISEPAITTMLKRKPPKNYKKGKLIKDN